MTRTTNSPKGLETETAGFGIVFAGGKIHGPTPVDNRGLGGSTKNKIPFMVVPGPRSPYFPEVDVEIPGMRAFKDREHAFWSIFTQTEAHAMEIVKHIGKAGGVS